MKSNRTRFLVTLGVALLIGSILGFVMRDKIRQIIVVPVAYFLWYANLILETAPQWMIWYGLLIVGAYYAIKILGKGVPADFDNPEAPVNVRGSSRYQFWLWYINTFHKSNYAQEMLARTLFHLITDIIMYQEHLEYTEIVALIDSGELNVPPEILEFLRAREFWELKHPYNWLDRLLDRLHLGVLFQRDNGGFHLDEASGKIEHIIRFIEDRLEVQRD
jgi:hypothetical protein